MFTKHDLIDAILTRNPKKLRLCLKNKVDPNSVDSEGCPAIILATRNKDKVMVADLITAGAMPLMEDASKKTALDHACALEQDNDMRVIVALLQNAIESQLARSGVLTEEQLRVIQDDSTLMTLRVSFAIGLAGCTELSDEHIKVLKVLLMNGSIYQYDRDCIVKKLSRHANFTEEQLKVFPLILTDTFVGCEYEDGVVAAMEKPLAVIQLVLQDSSIAAVVKIRMAEWLAKHADLADQQQWQLFHETLHNTSVIVSARSRLARGLAKREKLTDLQHNLLERILQNPSEHIKVKTFLSEGLLGCINFTKNQLKIVEMILHDTFILTAFNGRIAKQIANHENIPDEQWRFFVAVILDDPILSVMVRDSLVTSMARGKKFTVKQHDLLKMMRRKIDELSVEHLLHTDSSVGLFKASYGLRHRRPLSIEVMSHTTKEIMNDRS